MNNQRIDKINELMRHEIDKIIRNDLHDPRIKGTYSVTRVDATRDLSYAKVYISVFEKENREELIESLKHAAGFVRRELGHKMSIRYIPQLLFIDDHNIEYGIHIADVINKVQKNKTSEE